MTGLRSWIDEPSGASVDSPSVCIRGWCFDDGGRPIQAIRARLDCRTQPGRCGQPRPDVQAAFNGPPSSAQAGFSVCLRLAPGANDVRLEAKVAGAWTEFQRIVLRTRWFAALPHAFRLVRFRVDALLGQPDALDRLTKAERAFVFAQIEEKGGHPLRLSAHHPPKAVVPERFPYPKLAPKRMPKITVVTPSFQHGAFLEATLQSVLDQKGVRVDYIVQDGGSTDDTVKLLWRYAPRLKHWSSEKDDGQGDALKRGFARMEAGADDVMAYLNSDDLFMPGALRFVAEYFAKHPEVDVVYGHRVLIDEEGQEVGRWLAPRRPCDNLNMQDLIPQETLFWRKRIWDRVGGIDPSFQFAVDWDLLLRFSQAGARFVRLPWFLGLFRLHSEQKSQAKLHQVGIPEMNALRLRTLGRVPTHVELTASMQRAQLDSTLLAGLMRRGLRW